MERLRITPTPHHDDELVNSLLNALVEVWKRLKLAPKRWATAAE
jgi:5-aminolevulinate synthase